MSQPFLFVPAPGYRRRGAPGRGVAVLLAGAVALAAPAARALERCTITSVPTLAFGRVVAGRLATTTATLAVSCSRSPAEAAVGAGAFRPSVVVAIGGGAGQTAAARRLSGPGGRTLAYQIYKPGNAVWGDDPVTGQALELLFGSTAPNAPGTASVAVVGRIEARDSVRAVPGVYRDTVVLTVIF